MSFTIEHGFFNTFSKSLAHTHQFQMRNPPIHTDTDIGLVTASGISAAQCKFHSQIKIKIFETGTRILCKIQNVIQLLSPKKCWDEHDVEKHREKYTKKKKKKDGTFNKLVFDSVRKENN